MFGKQIAELLLHLISHYCLMLNCYRINIKMLVTATNLKYVLFVLSTGPLVLSVQIGKHNLLYQMIFCLMNNSNSLSTFTNANHTNANISYL